MKRIAIFSRGGVAQPGSTQEVPALAGLIRRLSELFEITVYLPVKSDGYDAPFQCGRATVQYVAARHDDAAPKVAAQMLRAFYRDHRERPYSLLQGFWAFPGGIAAVAAGTFSGLPSVVSILGGEAASLPEIRYGNMSRLIPREVTLRACGSASALVALTRYQIDRLRRHGFRRTEGVRVIPFGAESLFFSCAGEKPHTPPFNLLHVGDINGVKDQATLLRAVKAVSTRSECRLRIVGNDTLGGVLQSLAHNLGIDDIVTFAGFVPHRELPCHYSWAHMMVHSSLYEGEGVVFAEAAASGVPICGTRVGLLADLGDSIGLTAEPGDVDGLAENILKLIGDASRRDELRASAGAWSAGHDAGWTALQYAGLYGELT